MHWPVAVVQHLSPPFDRQHELTVRIVDTDESRKLNERFRGRDQATNVLSFPPAGHIGMLTDEATPLGDLVLCAPLIAREALEQAKDVGDHWAHLLVHGTLHLLGFDHEADAEAQRMEALEVAILRENGIEDPYIDRESAG